MLKTLLSFDEIGCSLELEYETRNRLLFLSVDDGDGTWGWAGLDRAKVQKMVEAMQAWLVATEEIAP